MLSMGVIYMYTEFLKFCGMKPESPSYLLDDTVSQINDK